MPALEQIIKRGGALGVKDIVVGMPHRGRLNVLAAVMAKPYRVIFHEFQGGSSLPTDIEGSGDVKYHLGASSDRTFDGNQVHLSLTANPSHLEIVNPVVLGKARAKQAFTLRDNPTAGRGHVLPLLMHGDAAFAGQGVVAECFNLMGIRGYRTGGAIHFIVNNQIGFTTSPHYSRTSPYPSDSALMVEAPIFHVNGDDPEAVTFAATGGRRVSPAVRQGRGHRHVLLPPLRSQRGRRPDDDPAVDVQGDQGASHRSAPVRQAAGGRGRGHRRRGRGHGLRVRRLPRRRVRGRQDLRGRQGRLARRQVGRAASFRSRRTVAARPPCRAQKLLELGPEVHQRAGGFRHPSHRRAG